MLIPIVWSLNQAHPVSRKSSSSTKYGTRLSNTEDTAFRHIPNGIVRIMFTEEKHALVLLHGFIKKSQKLPASQSIAIKRIFSWKIMQFMKKQGLSKTFMAARMNTSRSALDRLLDPSNESVTLKTMQNAAKAIGAHLEMKLVFDSRAA